MAETKNTKKTIKLGSGDLYIKEYKEAELEGIITNPDTVCTEENFAGGINGGATMKYSAEWYTASDDSGKYQKTTITSESATLSTALETWNGESLTTITATGRVTDTGAESGKRVTKLGGMDGFENKSYLLVFKHTDHVDGDCWIIIRGQNQGELEIAFTKDEESKPSLEFTALSQDGEGTLITFVEEVSKG